MVYLTREFVMSKALSSTQEAFQEAQIVIESPWRLGWRRFLRHRLAVLGMFVVVVLFLSAIFAPYITPYNPNRIDLDAIYQAPSPSHPFGTDDLGRDMLSRIIYGGRVSLTVGVSSILFAIVVGTFLGALSGFYGRAVDSVIMRITDLALTFPPLLILILLAALFGTSIMTIIFVIAAVSWMTVTRLVRASFLSLREQVFVEAARAQGANSARIIVKHILPSVVSPIVVAATLGTASAILTESTLSFLGLGIQPPTATWGNMLQTAQDQMIIAPWTAVFPGIMIFLTVMVINFVGDGLRDAFDLRKIIH